jgi:hypothetical protein
MTIGTSVYPPVTISGATNEKITPLLLTLANVEYSHSLQDGISQIRIKSREAAKLQLAFKVGESASNYWTIPKGTVDNIDGLSFYGKILYIQSDKPNTTVEIMELY